MKLLDAEYLTSLKLAAQTALKVNGGRVILTADSFFSLFDHIEEQAAIIHKTESAGTVSLKDVEAAAKRERDLTEALRSMVTIYVGVIADRFDGYTHRNVLQEPAVKAARILLGLEPKEAERP